LRCEYSGIPLIFYIFRCVGGNELGGEKVFIRLLE